MTGSHAQSVQYYSSGTIEQVVLQLHFNILLKMMLMSGDCLVPVLLQIVILIQLTSTAVLTNIIKMAVHLRTRKEYHLHTRMKNKRDWILRMRKNAKGRKPISFGVKSLCSGCSVTVCMQTLCVTAWIQSLEFWFLDFCIAMRSIHATTWGEHWHKWVLTVYFWRVWAWFWACH